MLLPALKGEPGDKQHPTAPRRRPTKSAPPVTTTGILAMIGGITVIQTAAARIPQALAEFLRACILVAAAARELRTALTMRRPATPLRQPGSRRADDFGH